MAQTAAQQAALAKATIAKLNAQIKKTEANIAATTAANPVTPALTDAQYDRKMAAQAAATAADAAAKQQAKDDAAANAAATAASINAMGITGLSSKVNPTTGMVETTKPTPVVKAPVFGDPGYVLKYGDPGYVLKPGDPGYNPAGVGAVKMTKEEWDAIQTQTAADAAAANEKHDAFALIQSTMKGYGFNVDEWNQLSKYIEDALINPKIGPNQMVLDMRKLPVYKARFAGNETRVAAGLNALSEGDYINQENSYAEYFKAGGVSELGTRAMYSKLIGGAVAPTEVGKRINMAVDRVQKADPEILKQLNAYYTNITDANLVSYFLDPTSVLPELEKKVTTAEIGTAAKEAGMEFGLDRISGLTAYGVDRAQAIAGYGNIGQVLPTSTKLGDIYKESGIKYDQTSGESEFFKSDAKAGEQRRQLKSLERSAFSAETGVSAQAGSLSRAAQGQF